MMCCQQVQQLLIRLLISLMGSLQLQQQFQQLHLNRSQSCQQVWQLR
jgi:hypothetical protein